MFDVYDDLSIYATRGDVVFFTVGAEDHGEPYTFVPGDIVRISITEKKDTESVMLQKDFPVEERCEAVFIYLEEQDTKFGDHISKHKDYWYEVVLNPDTIPQTLIGYDEDGPKIFRLFPESKKIDIGYEPEKEDFPVVDSKLDMTSPRPVSNQATAIAIAQLTAAVEELKQNLPVVEGTSTPKRSVFNAIGQVEHLSILTIDAYGVAVKRGFNGSVDEWLESLKGPVGPMGPVGPEGRTPQRGDDYWTEDDKQTIVDDVLSSETVIKIQQDITELREDMNYVPIDITSISNNIGTVEKGVAVPEMTVTWKLNKTPASQTIDGEAVDVSERSKTLSMEGKTSVTLVVTDERGATDSASTGYNAYNGVYYGVLADSDSFVDSAAILSLGKKIQSGRGVTFTAHLGDGARIAYAIPADYGNPVFKDAVNGYGVDMVQAAANLPFTNIHGYTTSYNVWLSRNILKDSLSVVVS